MAPLRFEAATKILGVKPHESVLDVGCGSGWLLEWLIANGWHGSYFGADPYEAAIKRFQTKMEMNRFPGCMVIAQERDIVGEWREDSEGFWVLREAPDWVYIMAVFAHRDCSIRQMDDLFIDMLDMAYGLCNKGVAISTFSTYKTEVLADEHAMPPEWLWQTGRRFSERIVMDCSYAPHETMLCLFKEKSPFRQKWEETGGWHTESGEPCKRRSDAD